MKTTSTKPMDASKQCCPHQACSARGQIRARNIRIHSYQPQRYRCRSCKKTFSARRGTMMEGLRTPTEVIVIVVILLAYGCPIQAKGRKMVAWMGMATGLADHIWSVSELLRFKVAPAPWVEPKRRGRPPKATVLDPTVPKRPRGRPRQVA